MGDLWWSPLSVKLGKGVAVWYVLIIKGGALRQECSCAWIIDVHAVSLAHSFGVYSSQLTCSRMTHKSLVSFSDDMEPLHLFPTINIDFPVNAFLSKPLPFHPTSLSITHHVLLFLWWQCRQSDPTICHLSLSWWACTFDVDYNGHHQIGWKVLRSWFPGLLGVLRELIIFIDIVWNSYFLDRRTFLCFPEWYRLSGVQHFFPAPTLLQLKKSLFMQCASHLKTKYSRPLTSFMRS